MKFLKLLVILTLLFPLQGRAEGFVKFRTNDKRDFYLHALTGYALNYTGSHFLHKKGLSLSSSILYSTAFSLVLLYGKEKFLDRGYSSQDMGANILGLLAGGVTFLAVEF